MIKRLKGALHAFFWHVIFYVSSAYFDNTPRSLSYISDFRFVMRHDKGNLSVASSPHLPTHPQHPLAIWKLSVILQNALSLHRARSTRRPLLFLFSFFFFFMLALRRPRSIPSLPTVRVCLSPVFAVVLRVTQIRTIITLRVGPTVELTYVNRA